MRGAAALLALLVLGSCAPKRTGVGADGRKVIRYFALFLSPAQTEYFRWAEATFEERHPGVDVVLEQFPGTSLKDFEIKLRLRFASRQEPDLFLANEYVVAPLATLGLLDEASEPVRRRVETNSLNEMVRRAPYTGGVCYGIALDAAWQALYYNKAMFAEAGLTEPPKTWDELIDYADRLTVRDAAGIPTRAGFSLRKTGFKAGTAEKWFTFLFSAGGVPFADDGTAAQLNTPQAREALRFYRAILDRKIDDVRLSGDQNGFGQGTVAMFLREPHVARWMKETHPDVPFGVAPIPAKAQSVSSGGAYVLAVSKSSPNRDEAWRFIEFLTGDEAYGKYVAIGGILPVMKSVAASPAVQADSVMRVFLEQPVKSPGHFPMIQRAADLTGAYLERYIYGLMTDDEMLQRMQRDVTSVLEANK